MRISSGYAKGLDLKVPAGLATRPTSAKVRAAVLNSLQADLPDARILELFAGSGALSIEALSRGARAAVLVERNREALLCLKQNVAELLRRADAQQLPQPELRIQAQDVGDYLTRGLGADRFDLVLVDPPYSEALTWLKKLCQVLPGCLKESNLLVFESNREDEDELKAILARQSAWELLKIKNYGDTTVSTLCYNHKSVAAEEAK